MPSQAQPAIGGDLAACCTPLTGGVLGEDAAARLARAFRALGDRHRVRLLSMIAAAPGGEACICDLTAPVGLSQPTVSHHMKQLVEAGPGHPRPTRQMGLLPDRPPGRDCA